MDIPALSDYTVNMLELFRCQTLKTLKILFCKPAIKKLLEEINFINEQFFFYFDIQNTHQRLWGSLHAK